MRRMQEEIKKLKINSVCFEIIQSYFNCFHHSSNYFKTQNKHNENLCQFNVNLSLQLTASYSSNNKLVMNFISPLKNSESIKIECYR